MSVEHDASVCGGYCGFVALNNLSLGLLLGNCLLDEAGLCRSLAQPCNVPLCLFTRSLLDSGHMTWSPYIDRST
jgi:hypothetical protein